MKARLISVLLVLALLVTVGVVAAQAAIEADAGWHNYDDAIEVASNSKDQRFTPAEAGGVVKAMCYHCGKEVDWKALPAATGDAATQLVIDKYSATVAEREPGHYYVPEGGRKANTQAYNVAGSNYVHVHLNGQTIQSSGSAFTTSSSTSAYLAIMGEGQVISTSATAATYDTLGELAIFGGTHKQTGGGKYVIKNSNNYTKRVWIAAPAVIDGTVAATSTNTGSAKGGASIRIYGATITRLELPVKYTSGSKLVASPTYIMGAAKISELVIPVNGAIPTWELSEGASIGIAQGLDTINQFHAFDAGTSEETAQAYAKYFYAADELKEVKLGKTSTKFYLYLANKEGVATCAGCGKATAFTELASAEAGAVAAGHYKLTGDWALNGALEVSGDVCVNLNGHNITSTGLVLEHTAGTLTVFGTGNVIGAAGEGEAATIVSTGGTLNLRGGTFKHTGNLPTIYSDAVINMYDGAKLTADLDANGNATVTGGNLYLYDSAVFTMEGGEISNGKATIGGNIYQEGGKDSQMYIKGGLITNGVATSTTQGGGNIYSRVGGMYLSGGTISNGLAAPTTVTNEETKETSVTYKGLGGNIYIRYMAINTSEITGSVVISGGKAKDGGNIFHNGGSKEMAVKGGTIKDGFAVDNGGNIYINASSSARNTVVKFSEGPTVSGGEADYGGSIFVAKDGKVANGETAGQPTTVTLSLLSGTYTGGSAINGSLVFHEGGTLNICGGTYNAGNASSRGDLFYHRGGNMLLSGGTMNLGDSGDYVVYIGQTGNHEPVLTLGKHTSGAWQFDLVLDEKAEESTIYVNNALAELKVLSTFENTAALNLIAAENNPVIPASDYYGAKVENATAEEFTGKLFLAKGDKPEILKDGNGGLVVAGAQKDGVWTTTADAFANAATNIKLYENNAEVTINKNTALVDLNGNNITVNGSGAFNAYNSNSAKAAEATLGVGVTTGITDGFAISGWKTTSGKLGGYYEIAIEGENNKVSYHKLEMAMTSISLRPNEAGLYYTSKVVADDSLKELISDAGILLGTIDSNERNENAVKNNMAGIMGKNAEAATAYAQEKGFSIVAPNDKVWTDITSVMIKGILQENNADWNGTYGEWPVIGTPFVVIADKYLPAGVEETKAYSMKEYLELAADAVEAGKITTQAEALAGFCTKYDVYNLGWGITSDSWIVPAPAPAPEEE